MTVASLTIGSIQELLLVASVGIASRLPERTLSIVSVMIDAALGVVRERATGYTQKVSSGASR